MGANKYSIFPITKSTYWKFFKKHQNSFWTTEEIQATLADDLRHLKLLTPDEFYFIKHILAFFAQSDGIVNENLCLRFYNDVESAEAKAFYAAQILIETIHAETYGVLIDTYVTDTVEKDRLFDAINTIPTIKQKAEWALKWTNSTRSFAERLVAFAAMEGLFFSGAFCAIFWLAKRGIMPGLTLANAFISRDEGLHWEFATEVFKQENLQLDQDVFHNIIIEAVEIEKDFICEALPVALIGMNSTLMAQYIQYTADRLTKKFGFKPIYNVENPFDFMRLIELEGKNNFFETGVSEYQRPADRTISFDSDF